jgi:hypothetical protein
MQRRHFLSSVLVAGIPALKAHTGSTPADFKRRFIAEARRQGRPLEWAYQPGAHLDPFLDFYPGDQWVSRWTLVDGPAGTMAGANARAFTAEAARRRVSFRKLAGDAVLDWSERASHESPGVSRYLYL